MGERSTHPTSRTGDSIGLDALSNGGAVVANGAFGAAVVDAQDSLLLADIEARLTREMHGLALSLREFAGRTKAIREEIPESAKFCKLVTGFFPLTALHIANALLSEAQSFTFKDDGALYLKQLGLELNDFVREIDLEGGKFLAVAFVDKSKRNILDGAAQGNEL